jgi:hypothetical protein
MGYDGFYILTGMSQGDISCILWGCRENTSDLIYHDDELGEVSVHNFCHELCLR